MLASLPLPSVLAKPRRVALQQFPTNAAGSTVVLHPRFANWLRRAGLDSAPAILALRGEVVCGHPDRHVARVQLPNGRIIFLKLEHSVGEKTRFKNWWAGFGPISRCEREAITLQQLEEAGLPSPQWLAYGQSDDGKSFLLIDNLAGGVDLLEKLSDKSLSPAERINIASRIGAVLAEYHEEGFATPDLSAKHLFLLGSANAVTVIDWQSTPLPGPVAWVDRVRALARLNSSLPSELANAKERLILLRSYLISCAGPKPKFSDLAQQITHSTRSFRSRSSSVIQLQKGKSIRLVWVDDERTVTIPELAKHWPSALEEAEPGQLTRTHNFDPLGRLWSRLRNVPWRSSAAKAARLLAQLQLANIPAPRLLAYGQTLKRFALASSFLLTDRPRDAVPYVQGLPKLGPARITFLTNCGAFLRSLHASHIALRGGITPALLLTHGTLIANAPDGVVRKKRPGFFTVVRDLRTLLKPFGNRITRIDRARMVRAYFGSLPQSGLRRMLVARLVRGGAR